MCEVFDKKKQEEITGESAEEEKQIVNHRDKLCRKKRIVQCVKSALFQAVFLRNYKLIINYNGLSISWELTTDHAKLHRETDNTLPSLDFCFFDAADFENSTICLQTWTYFINLVAHPEDRWMSCSATLPLQKLDVPAAMCNARLYLQHSVVAAEFIRDEPEPAKIRIEPTQILYINSIWNRNQKEN